MKRIILPVLMLLLPVLYAWPVSHLLPRAGDVKDWKPGSPPQYAVGDDLFLLINGGAEIFYEYGFKRAVTADYKNSGGKSINLEIYEMDSPAAAFGVYSFKIGQKGKVLDIGGGAMLEDYYLNFWKGPYLVTLVGFDPDPQTRQALTDLARFIAAKIASGGDKPGLVDLLAKDNLKANHVKYLRGNLALFNQYTFAPADIFAVREGVVGDYGDHKVFIFKYRDAAEARKCYAAAVAHLAKSERFKGFTTHKQGRSMVDATGTPVYVETRGDVILVLLGKDPKQAGALLQKINIPGGE